MAVDWTERIIEGVIVGTITSVIVLTVIPQAVTAAIRQMQIQETAQVLGPIVRMGQELM